MFYFNLSFSQWISVDLSEIVSGGYFHFKVLTILDQFEVYLQKHQFFHDRSISDELAKSTAFAKSWLCKALHEPAYERYLAQHCTDKQQTRYFANKPASIAAPVFATVNETLPRKTSDCCEYPSDWNVGVEMEKNKVCCGILSEYIFGNADVISFEWIAIAFLHAVFGYDNANEKLIKQLKPKEWEDCVSSGVKLLKRRNLLDENGKYIGVQAASTELMGQFCNTNISSSLIFYVALPIYFTCSQVRITNLIDKDWRFVNGPLPSDSLTMRIERLSHSEYGLNCPGVQLNYFYSQIYLPIQEKLIRHVIPEQSITVAQKLPNDSSRITSDDETDDDIVGRESFMCKLRPVENERRFALLLEWHNPCVNLRNGLFEVNEKSIENYVELDQDCFENCPFEVKRLVSFTFFLFVFCNRTFFMV